MSLIHDSSLHDSPRAQIIAKAASDWLASRDSEYENGLLFLLNRKTVERICEEHPPGDGLSSKYPRILKLFDCPVFPDDNVPERELHMRDNSGRLLGVIIGLAL